MCLKTGPRKLGEACDDLNMGENLCVPGLFCLHAAGKPGICRKLCCGVEGASYGDWRACDPGESCVRQITAQFEVPPGSHQFVEKDAHVFACVPVNNCDPLDRTSCTSDASDPERPVCRIADPLGNVACLPPGKANLGEPCDHTHQCGPVQNCAHTVDKQGIELQTLECRRLCRMAACGDQACPTNEGICVHFNRDPVGVGECTPAWPSNKCWSPDGGVLLDASVERPRTPNFCPGMDGGLTDGG